MGNLIQNTQKDMKRSNSWLFKRHNKLKARVERRLSQESGETETSRDSKEGDLGLDFEPSAVDSDEKSPVSKISLLSPAKLGKRKSDMRLIHNYKQSERSSR